MSEKRARQQQRRRRRRAAGQSRSTASGRASAALPPGLPWLDPAHEETLSEMLGEVAELIASEAADFNGALEAEMAASAIANMWRFGALPDPGGDADRLFGNALVRALERLGGSDAVVALLSGEEQGARRRRSDLRSSSRMTPVGQLALTGAG